MSGCAFRPPSRASRRTTIFTPNSGTGPSDSSLEGVRTAAPFCVVPLKEGGVRQVSDLDDLVTRRRRKLILLDDNLLAHPKAKVFLEDMVRRNLSVNFNQTLDLGSSTRISQIFFPACSARMCVSPAAWFTSA